MKNWLLWMLIFLFLFSYSAFAKWQLMYSPAQERLPQFCLLGYDWDVEPFVVVLQGGVGFKGEFMTWETKDYENSDGDHYFYGLSAGLMPTVNIRLEKYSEKRVVPFVQLRYSRYIIFGDSDLELPWIPTVPEEKPDLDNVDYTEIWESWRFSGGVRLKVSESLSLMGDYGLEATYLKADDLRYFKKVLSFEEHIRRIWPNTFAGVGVIWHW